MNNFLDLLAIKDIKLPVRLEIQPVIDNGVPNLLVSINNVEYFNGTIDNQLTVETEIMLLDQLCVDLSVSKKIYSQYCETAVIVKSFTVDGYELVNIHKCDQYISYQKDQNNDYCGFYLGFNGVWRFEIQEPFYRWLHTATGQGWLLTPMR